MAVSVATASPGKQLAARADAVLVQLVVPEDGEESYAILFFPDGRNIQVYVPDFTAVNLRELTREWDNAYQQYQQAALYDPRRAAAQRQLDKTRMLRVLELLFDRLIAPVFQALKGNGAAKHSQVVLLPERELARLPLHACWWKEKNSVRYLLDEFTISYVPRFSILEKSLEMNAQARRERGLGVGNPRLDQELALWEFDVIYQALGEDNCVLLLGERANFSNVVNEMAERHWVHFACHSEFNFHHPAYSRLYLAGKDFLYVHQIMNWGQLSGAYLVVLSSCESGLYGIADQLGLSTAFLAVGVPTVYATLWKVRDFCSLFLMTKTYQDLQEQGQLMSKPLALRKAQTWLRELTVEGALDWLRKWEHTAGPATGEGVRLFEKFFLKLREFYGPDHQYFDHPRLWSAFQCLGV